MKVEHPDTLCEAFNKNVEEISFFFNTDVITSAVPQIALVTELEKK